MTDIIVSADDAGASGQVQRVKLAYSADGVATHVTADANGLLVSLGANTVVLAAGTAEIGKLGAGTAEIGKLGAGTAAIGKLAANSGVDIGDIDVTSIIPGTGATNLGKGIDDPVTGGAAGVMAIAVRRDTEAASSGTTGDYEPLQTDSLGALRTSTAIVAADGTRMALASPISIAATPSIDAGAYAAVDNLDGNIISFANAVASTGGIAHLVGLSIQDKGDSAPNLSVFFLSDSITPEAQNAAFTMSDADAEKIVAVVHTASGTWEDYITGQKCFISPAPPKVIKCAATTLYAVVRVNATYTPASTSDLIITPTLLR